MVLQKEFRIVMPLTLDQYNLGQRYSTARMSKEVTNGQDGVELLESKSYIDEKTQTEGTYEHKLYHVGGWLPGWLKAFIPSNALKLEEKSWNAYPYCRTELSSPFFGHKFSFLIDSIHVLNDLGNQENLHNLDAKALKHLTVERIDIANDRLKEAKHNLPEEEPTLVQHTKADIVRKGPLSKEWLNEIAQNPDKEQYMCCYKLVTVVCKYTGISSKVENYIMSFERDIFLNFHRKMYAWLDDWFHLSLQDVAAEEQKMWLHSGKQLQQKSTDDGKQEVETVAN